MGIRILNINSEGVLSKCIQIELNTWGENFDQPTSKLALLKNVWNHKIPRLY